MLILSGKRIGALDGLPVRRVGHHDVQRGERQLLGWEPVRPGLIADLDNGYYCAGN